MIDSVEIPTAILGFPTMTSAKKVPQMIDTMTDNRKEQYGRLNRKYFISARHGRNPRIAVGISMLSIIVPDISVFPVWAAILLFPVVACCCYPLGTFFDVAVVGKLDFVTWITTIHILDLFCHISQHDHKISPVSKKIHTHFHVSHFHFSHFQRPPVQTYFLAYDSFSIPYA